MCGRCRILRPLRPIPRQEGRRLSAWCGSPAPRRWTSHCTAPLHSTQLMHCLQACTTHLREGRIAPMTALGGSGRGAGAISTTGCSQHATGAKGESLTYRWCVYTLALSADAQSLAARPLQHILRVEAPPPQECSKERETASAVPVSQGSQGSQGSLPRAE